MAAPLSEGLSHRTARESVRLLTSSGRCGWAGRPAWVVNVPAALQSEGPRELVACTAARLAPARSTPRLVAGGWSALLPLLRLHVSSRPDRLQDRLPCAA